MSAQGWVAIFFASLILAVIGVEWFLTWWFDEREDDDDTFGSGPPCCP